MGWLDAAIEWSVQGLEGWQQRWQAQRAPALLKGARWACMGVDGWMRCSAQGLAMLASSAGAGSVQTGMHGMDVGIAWIAMVLRGWIPARMVLSTDQVPCPTSQAETTPPLPLLPQVCTTHF